MLSCLNELVVHDTNGLVFNDSTELAEQLYTAFHAFPKNTQLLERLARGAKFDMGWHENWMNNALPVMLGEKEEKEAIRFILLFFLILVVRRQGY